MARTVKTLWQVVSELRALHSQFICPKDTYFSSMADLVERCRMDLQQARNELDLVANSIGTLKLSADITPADKDTMTEIVVHIDRFLKRGKAAAASSPQE